MDIRVRRRRYQCNQWFSDGVEGIYHRTHRTACRPSQNTQKVSGRKRLGVQCVQCAVADGFSVFSGQNCWRGWNLPQNTQNGLSADTEYTEGVGKEEAWRSVYFSVPPEAASVCSVVKTAGAGGIYHRWHRCGASADTDIHRWCWEGRHLAFSVFRVPPEAASVCSVVKTRMRKHLKGTTDERETFEDGID